MSRSHDEGKLVALRCFYERHRAAAPAAEAERIDAHVAALELSLEHPRPAALFQFLAIKHPRAFASFARRLAKPLPGLNDLPAGSISSTE